MGVDNAPFDNFGDLPEEEIFRDESQLKREITKLTRQLAKFRDEHDKDIRKLQKHQAKALLGTADFYENQIEVLKEQVRELFEKNLELHETSKIFVKGLEHLRQDGRVVTVTHAYHLRDKEDLMVKIKELTDSVKFGPDLKRRIVSIVPTRSNSHGQATEVVIVTEHIDKGKK